MNSIKLQSGNPKKIAKKAYKQEKNKNIGDIPSRSNNKTKNKINENYIPGMFWFVLCLLRFFPLFVLFHYHSRNINENKNNNI